MGEVPPAVEDRLKKLRASIDHVPLMLFFSIGAGSLCSLVGFIYPAYKSFEAIEGKKQNEVITQWLIYWVVYSLFAIIEVFVDFLLFWIPFYYTFKMAFLLWAMLPQTRGAKYLYDSFLKDFLKKNESEIDAALHEAKKNASTVVQEAAKATAELSVTGAAKVAGYAASQNGTNGTIQDKKVI